MEQRFYINHRMDHLGIVAGICRRIGLIERIDEAVGPTQQEVSCGEAVQAMVLNALGFVGRPLYLMPEFFRNKPLDVLIRPGLRADQLNDDLLGRTLDRLYRAGVTEVFAHVSASACRVSDIVHTFYHLDSSSFSFHGNYRTDEVEDSEEPHPIRITQGHSKDGRPDLKQAVLSLICSHRSALPVWMEALGGNASDKVQFPATIEAFCEQLGDDHPPFFVVDSALYSRENLSRLGETRWLTRVPATLKAVRTLYATEHTDWEPGPGEGYRHRSLKQDYGGVPQRWVQVFSQPLLDRHLRTLEDKVRREGERVNKVWRQLLRQEYECETDARTAAQAGSRKWKWHTANFTVEARSHYEKRGRPRKGQPPDRISWHIRGEVEEDESAIEQARRPLGQFVVATNELDVSQLDAPSMVDVYKSQGVSVERGFRFLKDPLFFAHALFLKKPERIMALLMIMTLALLVYALAARSLQEALVSADLPWIPGHDGRPIERITLRRVFQLFEGVELLTIIAPGLYERRLLNFQPLHRDLLRLIGHDVEKIYRTEWRCGM